MGQMTRIHPLDKLISDDSLFLLEALVPFIEYPYKKMLVLFIKYRELMAIMDSLNDRNFISSCGFDCHPKNTEEMLASMCDFLPSNMSSSMKQMKQMMGMMEMMNAMPQPNPSPPQDSLFDSVLSILNDQDTNKNMEY